MQGVTPRSTITIPTASATETEALGEALGRQLEGGEVIALASDLGGGKTTFVRGLARGAGSTDHVASPTFTVSKVYKVSSSTKKLEIHHFDFYRLQEAGIMRNELAELIGDPMVVVVVEWSGIVSDVLPKERIDVQLSSVRSSDTARTIIIEWPKKLGYMMKELPT